MNLLRLYGRVLALLGSESRLAWALAIANIALASAQFAEPVLLGRIIDTLTAAQVSGQAPSWAQLGVLLSAWAGFGLFTIACGTLIALYADRLSHRRRHVVLTGYFEHVLQLPLTYHGNTHSGRLMKVMLQGTDALWGLWVGFFRDNLASIVSLLVLLPISLFINWRLALLLIVLCVVFALLTALIVRKTQTLQSSVERHYSDLAERASDTLGNIALVQSFSRLEQEVTELRQVVERLLAAQMPVLSWWALAAVLTRTATTLTVLSIIIVGTLLHINGQATIGEMVTFMNFAGLIINRLEQVVAFVNRIGSEAPRLREFFTVWDTVPAIRDLPDAVDPGRLTGMVEFKNVSFSYDGERMAAIDLNLKAMPGDTIALVGATGAGKSTAIALLHRAFDPQSGSIEIDGVDIRHFKLAALRRNIGVVFQESLLFNRSISDNLRVGKADATEEEMRLAATRAQAIDFIDRKFHGFSDNVGERGRSLSGGERQRLSIARALLKDPPILILDEATSALDAGTEGKVMQALDEVMKGRTTFVIAHRLSTVRKASRILVFEAGKIVEAGTFDELVAQGGRLAELAKAQFITTESAAAPKA
ncbi:MAG: glucan ABC transporter ATP-binding protein/ permease [Pseudolabrys sp.]|nr:glucan ABC transporter ATP-binding protein/ permease [Pseudolabrys sp.]MDP2298511.1 glucan ABC transporter ATP-binding protein/ permease [Pseudolabrys sp.]